MFIAKKILLLFLFGLPLFYFGCGGESPVAPDSPAGDEVWIHADGFDPVTRTVTAGTTVIWINKDNQIHTVESGVPDNPDLIFTSPNLKPNAIWSNTFPQKGTFNYFCGIHRKTAKIIVQ